MSERIKLSVIGGFLGSGKTTTILSIAKKLIGSGTKVGIVTNDQGSDLVDTNFLRSAGFPVLEVEGGCFCCNFEEFVGKLNTLAREQLPDIILAEPVGSCTDLVASIFKPLQLRHTENFVLAPLMVLADPRRVRRLMTDGERRFQSEINYLFKKQLEEADIILLSKADLYTGEELDELKAYLKKTFKGTEVAVVSAKEGRGLSEILPVILAGEAAEVGALMELDYDVYGLAESFLGWFNATAAIASGSADEVKAFVTDFMEHIKGEVAAAGKEIAHLKTYAMGTGGYLKASITSVEDTLDFYEDNFKGSGRFSLVVNARMNVEPDVLNPMMEQAIHAAAQKRGIEVSEYKSDCFTPGAPSGAARGLVSEEGCDCSCCGREA